MTEVVIAFVIAAAILAAVVTALIAGTCLAIARLTDAVRGVPRRPVRHGAYYDPRAYAAYGRVQGMMLPPQPGSPWEETVVITRPQRSYW
jgi:hypothetical protein